MNNLTDDKLMAVLKDCVAYERKTVLQIITYLKEVQRRRLFSDYGYSSLHAFCVGELGYSDGETSRKIRTIKLVDVLPQAEDMIKEGSLNITGASSLFTHLKQDKCSKERGRELLKKIENKSTREIEKILSEESSGEVVIPPETKRSIKGSRVVIKFSVSQQEYALLQDTMNEMGVDSMEQLVVGMRQKLSRSSEIKSRKSKPSSKREYISAKIRREVLLRDGNCCVFCKGKRHLQIDHIIPVGKNGDSSASNLRTTCRNCNLRLAVKVYGMEKMDRYINPAPVVRDVPDNNLRYSS